MAASACNAAREAPFLDHPGAGAPTCVFMTGVTKNVAKYLPGVVCIMQRLHDLRSRYPLVLAVSADEAEQAQAELDAVPELSVNTTVIRWSRFPHAPRLSGWARRWQGSRVLDKLNVLGAPFERVVWLDPDMLLTRNVDELCEMRGRLAAAYNAGHEARTCWSNTSTHLGDQCQGCRHHGIRRDERANTYWVRKGLDEQSSGVREGKPLCDYEVNTGVMVIEPFNRCEVVLAELTKPPLATCHMHMHMPPLTTHAHAASNHMPHAHAHAASSHISHACTCTIAGRRLIGWSTSLRVAVHSRAMEATRASSTVLHTGTARLTT